MQSSKIEKLVIIGSGPAGLTAAIYAARGGLSPLVISGREIGGQLMSTTDVDDFPGFPEGIQGPDLMVRMRKQAEKFGTRFVDENVVNINFTKTPFTVTTETQTIKTQTVILATGASAKWLNLQSEQKLRGKGVSACATCDGFFFKDKNVLVVGGGDTAMREAQHLSKICKKVTLIHRKPEFRAQNALVGLVKAKPNIEFIMDSTIEEFLGDEKLLGVKVKNQKSGEITEMLVDGVFIAIGHQPNTKFINTEVALDEQGYILIQDETRTNIAGIFVAGDVADHKYRQAVTAAGSGCKAALDVDEYLENKPSN